MTAPPRLRCWFLLVGATASAVGFLNLMLVVHGAWDITEQQVPSAKTLRCSDSQVDP